MQGDTGRPAQNDGRPNAGEPEIARAEPTDELGHDHEDEVRCESCWNWDPLAGLRRPDDPPLDVVLSGTVFFDLIFTGLKHLPGPGEEIWSQGMGSCPGGIANLAVASARMGLRTGLVAGFGDDGYADWLWNTLSEQEGIDLSCSSRFEKFHTAVTVSMAWHNDRAMLTHGHRLPHDLGSQISGAPRAKAAIVDLGGETGWWQDLSRTGTKIVADIGFDEDDAWDVADLEPLQFCHAFTPNAIEAMAYTRTASPREAARALAERVPLVVVTDGDQGAVAIDASTGEEASVSAVAVDALDATGAGDVFCAALLVGEFKGWPLVQRLRFAALSSALSVQQFGGSLAAPGWGDISDWWALTNVRARHGEAQAAQLVADYGFLSDCLPKHRVLGVRRAEGTFALGSDAGRHGATDRHP